MDNELIPEKNWWRANLKWLLPLAILGAIGLSFISFVYDANVSNMERENGIVFDQKKWNMKNEDGFAYRNVMLKDLIKSNKLKKLKKQEIIDLLGQPDRIDSAYLFYRVAQQRIGEFPLHTTTLVIKISNDTTGNAVMVHD
jgi:hypothetical protein